jgi:hypothetical protein
LILFSLIILAFSFKAADRYFGWLVNPDKSVTNRFAIWKGATQIIADNPRGTGG